MEFAFPIPDHLPRAAQPRQADISTSILTALSEASPINLAQTNDWVQQLNEAINQTELAIHNRIHQDLEAFERQTDTSRSIQRRFNALTSNIGRLHTELEDAETGSIPRITQALREHFDVAQRALDSTTTSTSLQYLQKCKQTHGNVVKLTTAGELPAAVLASTELQALVEACPSPLRESLVVLDLQHVARSSRDNVLEQLSGVYHSCLLLKNSKLSIQHRYKRLSLSDILASIPSQTLVTDLATLRKDIIAQFIRPALSIDAPSIFASSTILELQPSRSSSPFKSVLEVFSFLREQLVPHLPELHRKSFVTSFYPPLCDAVEAHLLNAMPRGIDGLPTYLDLVLEAINLEVKIVEMGFFGGMERRIHQWGVQVQSHYEKRRRTQLLEEVRTIILSDSNPPVRIEIETPSVVREETHPAQEANGSNAEDEEGNWDFDDDDSSAQEPSENISKQEDNREEDTETAEGDGWGFDDDDVPTPAEGKDSKGEGHDPWGVEWDDMPVEKTEPSSRDTAAEKRMDPSSSHPQSAHTPNSAPNVAKRFEQESYFVSHVATAVSSITKQILEEGLRLSGSSVFKERGFTASHPAILLSTAPSALDLFRGLYPTGRLSGNSESLAPRLQYSNDCKYLAEVSEKLRATYTNIHQSDADALNVRFEEVTQRLEMTNVSWLEDTMDEEAQALLSRLAEIGGFDDLGHNSRYEEAHGKIRQIKNRITIFSQELKSSLAISIYNQNLGMLIDRVLDRVLQDVFALDDISEIVSERIATICRTLHPLEALFPEIENVSTVASYASLWLKFTYLSDILEGSLADISSWFDSGLLIDYEPQELCRLVRALFADTPHRAAFISRILNH
ncbi:hypothetical protein FRC18_012004 [Serendipita sp. 400]|nr:hypothetical protein FRC18_012004 [Serendipita sp. 400]